MLVLLPQLETLNVGVKMNSDNSEITFQPIEQILQIFFQIYKLLMVETLIPVHLLQEVISSVGEIITQDDYEMVLQMIVLPLLIYFLEYKVLKLEMNILVPLQPDDN